MNIHEHQAKKILKKYGAAVPEGVFALNVKDLVEKGKTEDEIYSFMADKYGEWIVFNPVFNKTNFLLWSLPYVIFLMGGFLIFSFFRKSKKN